MRESYRVWHGISHMDDARQAPVNYSHFDGYSMGASSDSPFAAGAHIPGLNLGGWYDAGDYDLRTQTQARVITDLVLARETFQLKDGWPYLWYENEYVVDAATTFILAANAAATLSQSQSNTRP